jgi:hypothetical protein
MIEGTMMSLTTKEAGTVFEVMPSSSARTSTPRPAI